MYINEYAEICTVGGVFLLNARFLSKDEHHIHLVVKRSGIEDIIKVGQNLLVFLTSPVNGVMPFVCKVNKDSLINPRFAIQEYISLRVAIVKEEPHLQRRRDIKVKTNIDVKIELVEEEKEDNKQEPKKYSGFIKDISATGILFVTREVFPIDQKFKFVFDKIKPSIELVAKIIRKQDEIEGYYGYGCMFEDITSHQQEALRGYIFKLQIEQHRISKYD